MTRTRGNPSTDRCGLTTGTAAARCGTTGSVAALICALHCISMPVLVALGAGSSTAAGMANHSGGRDDGIHGAFAGPLDLLQRVIPGLLIVSIVLIAGAFALRRVIAVIPALLAGAVVYASVRAQADPVVMYTGMAVGYGTWIGLYLWVRRGKPVAAGARDAGVD